jgi:hypothetical protein
MGSRSDQYDLSAASETMTVDQLVAALQALQAQGLGSLPMASQGCDCDGDVVTVTVETRADGKREVYLGRY